jgi:hypothetical protein
LINEVLLLEVSRELRRISSPAEPKSAAIGMEGKRAEITLYQTPIDLDPSPALSLVGKAKPMVKGLKIGALVSDGADGDRLQALRDTLEGEEAELAIVALLDARSKIVGQPSCHERHRSARVDSLLRRPAGSAS